MGSHSGTRSTLWFPVMVNWEKPLDYLLALGKQSATEIVQKQRKMVAFQNRLFQWSVLRCSNKGYRGQAARHREKKLLLALPYGEKSVWSYALRYHNAEWHCQFPEDHLNVIWERDFQKGPKIFPQQKSLIFTSHDRKTASPNDYSVQKTVFLLKEITILCSYLKKNTCIWARYWCV